LNHLIAGIFILFAFAEKLSMEHQFTLFNKLKLSATSITRYKRKKAGCKLSSYFKQKNLRHVTHEYIFDSSRLS